MGKLYTVYSATPIIAFCIEHEKVEVTVTSQEYIYPEENVRMNGTKGENCKIDDLFPNFGANVSKEFKDTINRHIQLVDSIVIFYRGWFMVVCKNFVQIEYKVKCEI